MLVVDDDEGVRTAVTWALEADGFEVVALGDGLGAWDLIESAPPSLVVLDLSLPGLGGLDILRRLRSAEERDGRRPLPIIVLSGRDSETDRIVGLDLGADDYLAKPFAYVELLARLRALARRTTQTGQVVLSAEGVRVDTLRRIAERDGRPLALTPKELGVLEALLLADGGHLTADDLLADVWEHGAERTRAVVKLTVHTLRRKLGAPDVIHTSPGLGYRIGAPA